MQPVSIRTNAPAGGDAPGRPIGPAAPMPGLELPSFALPLLGDKGTTLRQLPPPPIVGTPEGQRDLAAVQRVAAQRTPAGDAWARAMDVDGPTAVWAQFAGRVSGEHAAVAQAVVGAALRAASMQGAIGKRTHERLRPFRVDPQLEVIGRVPDDPSYPSIHSTRAFAAARVLGELDPKLANDAWAMAREVAISRVYAGVHFPTDIEAGARLGISLAESVITRWRAGKLKGERVAGVSMVCPEAGRGSTGT